MPSLTKLSVSPCTALKSSHSSSLSPTCSTKCGKANRWKHSDHLPSRPLSQPRLPGASAEQEWGQLWGRWAQAQGITLSHLHCTSHEIEKHPSSISEGRSLVSTPCQPLMDTPLHSHASCQVGGDLFPSPCMLASPPAPFQGCSL